MLLFLFFMLTLFECDRQRDIGRCNGNPLTAGNDLPKSIKSDSTLLFDLLAVVEEEEEEALAEVEKEVEEAEEVVLEVVLEEKGGNSLIS